MHRLRPPMRPRTMPAQAGGSGQAFSEAMSMTNRYFTSLRSIRS